MYEQDSLSALDAITEAQRIAFAPMLFQTALCLRNAGVLSYLDRQGKHGATLADITEHSHINEYAASVLLDMGLSGHYLLHDAYDSREYGFTPRMYLTRGSSSSPIHSMKENRPG